MQFTFLDFAGKVLFVRDDAERAQWTTEEMSLDLEFPYLADKAISIGQRVFFIDPVGKHQIYEVKQAKTVQPDNYQQVVAEHICISELSDCHIDNKGVYGVPPQTALNDILPGTLWSVGKVSVGNLAKQSEIKQRIKALGLNGNVDLTSRPIISPEKMKAAGYINFDGDYATLYSMTYDPKIKSGERYTILMTPIQQNGTVLSQKEIDSYVDQLCAASNTMAVFKSKDTKGLLIHYLAGERIAQMDTIAIQAHDLSDEWETANKDVLSSAELSRGSVWQAILQIKDNWNVYIEPRVTLADDGTITRLLDIKSTDGVWNGVRLSVDKNMLDPSVTYDDSELATALYGYGGTIHPKDGKGEDVECTFEDVVWKKTADHPAKPKGQNYIEDPAATKAYGRNGKARFSYFQNNDITDPEILLQKTWETLKTVSSPAISIEGTVADLYRLGYADQPLALHDIALVEILPSGFVKQIQIIRMTVDLLDPSATTLTIGSYIPNIIYIQRQTDMDATGSRGGGGGNKSKETERHEFETAIESINAGTGLRFRAFQNDLDDMDNELKLQEARITINHDAIELEVTQRSKADNELKTDYTSKITQTAKEIRSEVSNVQKGLQSQITQNADNISLVVSNGKIKSAEIVASINRSGSEVKISADHIVLDGTTIASLLDGQTILCNYINSNTGVFGPVTATNVATGDIQVQGSSSLGSASCSSISSSSGFKTEGYTATWQHFTYRHCTVSSSYTFKDTSGTNRTGKLVTATTDTTIYYLGR